MSLGGAWTDAALLGFTPSVSRVRLSRCQERYCLPELWLRASTLLPGERWRRRCQLRKQRRVVDEQQAVQPWRLLP